MLKLTCPCRWWLSIFGDQVSTGPRFPHHHSGAFRATGIFRILHGQRRRFPLETGKATDNAVTQLHSLATTRLHHVHN